MLSAGNHRGRAHGLQRGDGLGDEGGLLLDDGVIDGSAETLIEDFHSEQLGTGGSAILVGPSDGDVEVSKESGRHTREGRAGKEDLFKGRRPLS